MQGCIIYGIFENSILHLLNLRYRYFHRNMKIHQALKFHYQTNFKEKWENNQNGRLSVTQLSSTTRPGWPSSSVVDISEGLGVTVKQRSSFRSKFRNVLSAELYSVPPLWVLNLYSIKRGEVSRWKIVATRRSSKAWRVSGFEQCPCKINSVTFFTVSA